MKNTRTLQRTPVGRLDGCTQGHCDGRKTFRAVFFGGYAMWGKNEFCCAALAALLIYAQAGAVTVQMASQLDKRWEATYVKLAKEMVFNKASNTGNPAKVWPTDLGPVDIIARRTEALLDEISAMPGSNSAALNQLRSELTALQGQTTGNESNKALFKQFCAVRRKIAMLNPLLNFTDIMFAGHLTASGQFHSYSNNCWSIQDSSAGLYRLSGYKSDVSVTVTDMLENARVNGGRLDGKILSNSNPEWLRRAVFYTPTISPDTQRIAFAWARTSGYGYWEGEMPSRYDLHPDIYITTCWKDKKARYKQDHVLRIFTMDIDGSDLRMLDDAPGVDNFGGPGEYYYDDYDPVFLPSGRILFVSDRHNGGQRCGEMAVSGNMYTCKADGSDLYRISWHETNERCPTVDNDGDIVYSRWDYIDRHAFSAQSFWKCGPDGSDPRAYHGMYNEDDHPFHVISETDVMPIPGTRGKYVAVAHGHHHAYFGNLIMIDINNPSRNPATPQARWFWPSFKVPLDKNYVSEENRFSTDGVNRAMRMFTTPYPLSEDYVIAGEYSEILLLDKFGNEVMLFDAEPVFSRAWVHYPIPIRVTPQAPVVELQTYQGERRADAPKAVLSVMNVYETDTPLPQGVRITHLRICQVLGRPKNPWDTHRGRAFAWGDGGLLKHVIGTVPVEEDGSVFCEAPIEREIYFQLVDSTGMAVTSMLSGTYVHPGEHLTCIGCHEDKWTAAEPGTTPMALRRAPSTITPEVSGSYPLTYQRLVKKPVFDQKCLPCHQEKNVNMDLEYWTNTNTCGRDSHYDLWAGRLEQFVTYYNAAYDKLYCRSKELGSGGLFLGYPNWKDPITGQVRSRSIPMKIGARACALTDHLYESHTGSGQYKLTDEEFHRATLWMDLNCQDLGSYSQESDDMAAQRAGQVVWPQWEHSGMDPNNPTGIQLPPYGNGTYVGAPQPQLEQSVQRIPVFRRRGGMLVLENLPHGEVRFVLYSLSGRRITGRTIRCQQAGASFAQPLTGFVPGLYVASVHGQNGRAVAEEAILIGSGH